MGIARARERLRLEGVHFAVRIIDAEQLSDIGRARRILVIQTEGRRDRDPLRPQDGSRAPLNHIVLVDGDDIVWNYGSCHAGNEEYASGIMHGIVLGAAQAGLGSQQAIASADCQAAVEPPLPTAEIVPFPAARRVGQIRKTAAYIASAPPKVAASHLAMQADKLTAGLSRKGLPQAAIAAEVAAYRSAVQAEVWRQVLTPKPNRPEGSA